MLKSELVKIRGGDSETKRIIENRDDFVDFLFLHILFNLFVRAAFLLWVFVMCLLRSVWGGVVLYVGGVVVMCVYE